MMNTFNAFIKKQGMNLGPPVRAAKPLKWFYFDYNDPAQKARIIAYVNTNEKPQINEHSSDPEVMVLYEYILGKLVSFAKQGLIGDGEVYTDPPHFTDAHFMVDEFMNASGDSANGGLITQVLNEPDHFPDIHIPAPKYWIKPDPNQISEYPHVYGEQLPNGQIITVQEMPRSESGSAQYYANLWHQDQSRILDARVISHPMFEDLKSCDLGPRMNQITSTCYFNAAFNGFLLGQRGRNLLLRHILAFVSALSPSERQVFLTEPLLLDRCPSTLTKSDVLRYMFAMLCSNSPTPLKQYEINGRVNAGESVSNIPEQLVRGMKIRRTTSNSGSRGQTDSATTRILAFLGYAEWTPQLNFSATSDFQQSFFQWDLKNVQNPALLKGLLVPSSGALPPGFSSKFMQLPEILRAKPNENWMINGLIDPAMTLKFRWKWNEWTKDRVYVLDHATIAILFRGSGWHAAVACFCKGKPKIYDSAIDRVFPWTLNEENPKMGARAQVAQWQKYYQGKKITEITAGPISNRTLMQCNGQGVSINLNTLHSMLVSSC